MSAQHSYCSPLNPVADPLLARLLASRHINPTSTQETSLLLSDLIHYKQLHNCERTAQRIAVAIEQQETICIVGDYDADGATATALMLKALTLFGAQHLTFLVPSRFSNGYGLSADLVENAHQQGATLLITVDNGIGSVAAIEYANNKAIDVVVTDHHLPGETLPDAYAIVNPNQDVCNFPSKALAGVGVAFYVMLAVRALVKQRIQQQLRMSQLLDLVAIGTLADLVPLDANNRILVQQGLVRIRRGQASQGVAALLQMSNISADMLTSTQVGFHLAPKINAAGRLADMEIGVRCLIADTRPLAHHYAEQLCALNAQRKTLQQDILKEAMQQAQLTITDKKQGLCLFNDAWHEGLVGIIAGNLKDTYHMPVVVFALGEDGYLKGSARSVDAIHIRDLLAIINARHPSLLASFGGHAMAAGVRITRDNYALFADTFTQTLKECYAQMEDTKEQMSTDGAFPFINYNYHYIKQLVQSYPWGKSFAEPVFCNILCVMNVRVVGAQHLRFVLQCPQTQCEVIAMYFFAPIEQTEITVGCVYYCLYSFLLNEFQGERSAQLSIQQLIQAEHSAR